MAWFLVMHRDNFTFTMTLSDIWMRLLEWKINPQQGHFLHRTTLGNTEKCRHTSRPQVGFEPVITVFEQPKTLCVSYCTTTLVI